MVYIYISGLILGLCSGVICWLLLRILMKYHLGILALDHPNQRSLHSKPIPRGAGIVIAGILVVVSVGLMPIFSGVESDLLAFGISAAVLGILGWLDDQKNLKINTKLVVECIVSIIALWLIKPGTYIQLFSDKVVDLSEFLVFPLTILGVVWITNVYNFMDGIDGLVASQTILSSVVIAGWLIVYGDIGIAMFCLTLGGGAAGFLVFNWSPAKIFLGDAGSLTLGALFGLLAVYGILVHQIPVTAFLLLYGVFLADTVVTLVRRLIKGEKWWEAHSTHFYQRAVRTGVDHRTVSIMALLASGSLAILGTLEVLSLGNGLIWLGLGMIILLLIVKVVHIREGRLSI